MILSAANQQTRSSGDLYGFIKLNGSRSVRVMLSNQCSLLPNHHTPILYTSTCYGERIELYYVGTNLSS